MKGMKKTVCCLLSLVMLLGLVPFSASVASAAVKMETASGYLDFEAEDTKYDSSAVELVNDKGMYSGGKALAVTSENKFEGDNVPASEKPHIDLSFKADIAGTYTIWMRNTASVADTAGQSVYFSYGVGGKYAWTKLNGERTKPAWTKLCSMSVAAGETAIAYLRVRQKEGIAFDRFIITSNTSFKPDDVALGITKATPTPTPVPVDKVSIKTKDGNAILEAESLKYNKSKLDVVSGDDLSGKKGLSVIAEDKSDPAKGTEADIDLTFVGDVAGSYTLWMRNAATQENSSGNSIYLSLPDKDYTYFRINGQPDSPEWTKLGTVTLAAGGVGVVRIIARQSYQIRIDKFIITSNKAFNPVGMDPDPNVSSVTKLPSGAYPMPSVTPPAAHPRLFFTAKDVPMIKANMESAQNANAVAAWKANMEYATDGTFKETPGKSNFDYKVFNAIEAKAFDYAINKNAESGKSAIAMMKNALASADFNADTFKVRVLGRMIVTTAKVYDWCYDLLSADDRTVLAAGASAHASGLSVGYPPGQMGVIVGHGAEGQLLYHLMSFAIATYNEYPDIYNYVAGRFFAEYVEPRDYYYQSGSYHQGSAYTRYSADILVAWMYKRMSGVDVFNDNFHNVFYELLYRRRPDGQNLRTGDDFNEYGNSPGMFWPVYGATLFYGANYYGDAYLKREYQKCAPQMNSFFEDTEGVFSATMHLLMNDPALDGKSVTALPTTRYFGSPNGAMIARTGWQDGYESPDAMAYMKIGEVWSANHEHLDSGNFQIYYKGILASESGYYGAGYGVPHDYNYHKRSIAHNLMTIYDPNEAMNYYGVVANDGGQKTPANGTEPANMSIWQNGSYERAEVKAHEFGPDPVKPEYSYLAGDLTKAYSEKVSEVLRDMVFLPLEDKDHPAAFVVFDKVTSKDASFKKSWLLHMQEEPKVSGNKITVTRTKDAYNGRMVNETLLPKDVAITSIGGEGKQFMIGEKNFAYDAATTAAGEVGWGRVEVSPKSANKTDYFLNVMQVSDADTTAQDLKSTLIEGDTYAGAVIADRVAIFSKDKARTKNSISFNIPGSGQYKVFVSGLTAGKWSNGAEDIMVSEDGGVAYFTANAGSVTLTYKDASKKEQPAAKITDVDTIGIKVKNMFIYSDVPAFIQDDRTLVPMRAIFEALGVELEWDGATSTATAKKDGRVVTITNGNKTAHIDGKAVELDVTAQIFEGRFVVPLRFVSESFNAKVSWDPFARVALITPGVIVIPNAVEGQATIADCKWSTHFEDQDGYKSYDGDLESMWSTGDLDAWVIYEFDKEYTIESVYLHLNKATERHAIFDILASTDGTTFTPVITSGVANGTTEGETVKFSQPVTAKYIKYIQKGSEISEWGAIKEIQFNVKK